MKVAIISASTRKNSQSRNVSEYLKGLFQSEDIDTAVIDLSEQVLPIYDDSENGDWQSVWQPIENSLSESDAFVLVSPEWDGMFSAGLHNMFNYVASGSSANPMAHKPAMLVGVSSGMGGAYPIAQMREVGPKNTHFVVSPENLRFAKVKEVLVDGQVTVNGLRERAEYSVKVLIEYAKALNQVRDSDVIDMEKFGSGM